MVALREMSSLIIYRNRELEFPNTILKFRVSIYREFREKAQPLCGDFPAPMRGNCRKMGKFPVFSLFNRELGCRDGFDRDCIIRQAVRDFNVLCGKFENRACSRTFSALRASEKIRFVHQQPVYVRFSLSRIEPVPWTLASQL
jgi:hypothetical protein